MNQPNDLVKQRYLAVNTDVLYCSDITTLSPKAYLALVLDAASRLILAHSLTSQQPTSQQLIQMLQAALKNRKLRPNVTIFHSDRGAQYTSHTFQQFLKQADLVPSLALPQSHGNQLAEILNRTIKRYIRAGLVELFGKQKHQKTRLDLLVNRVDFETLSTIVNKAVERYCSKPHKGVDIYQASPFDADQALTTQSCQDTSITRNDNQQTALSARAAKANKILAFAQNEQHLLNLESPTLNPNAQPLSPDTSALMQHTSQLTLGLARQNANIGAALAEQNRTLYEQNRKLETQVSFLVQEAKTLKTQREAKESRRHKRLNATKQKQRDAATPEQFNTIMQIASENTYNHARIRVALLIMYFTGLRVSNLLNLTVQHVQDLLEKQEITISIIKRGPTRHSLIIGNAAKNAFENARPDIHLLSSNKEPQDFFFTPAPNRSNQANKQPLARETFDRQINQVLRKASALIGKHFRSHSFRATFINTLLEAGIPIHKVKEIVGHSSIKSTAAYQRTFLGKKELKLIMGTLSKAHAKSFVRPTPLRKTTQKPNETHPEDKTLGQDKKKGTGA